MAHRMMTMIDKGIKICTFNIQHHGNSHLLHALHKMKQMNGDIGILMEIKAKDNSMLPMAASGYSIACMQEGSSNMQGGVLLFYHDSASFIVESIGYHGNNVITCTVVSSQKRWKLIGAYIPLLEHDSTTICYIETVLQGTTALSDMILIGDINMDLRNSSILERNMGIAMTLASFGLRDISRCFLQCNKHRWGWTWRMGRGNKVIKGQCDVVMSTDSCHFQSVSIVEPPQFTSDHFMLVATIKAAPPWEQMDYLWGCCALPNLHKPHLVTQSADRNFEHLVQYKIRREKEQRCE